MYTIGWKSFLMGSRVQSWGRDYQREICKWCDLHLAPLHPRSPGPGPVHSALSRGTGGAQVRTLGQKDRRTGQEDAQFENSINNIHVSSTEQIDLYRV